MSIKETIRYFNTLGQLHRIGGPAIEYVNGTKCWYVNGNRHREDGPAKIFSNGEKHYYINDCLHRVDGPAIECPVLIRYYIMNKLYSYEDWLAIKDFPLLW